MSELRCDPTSPRLRSPVPSGKAIARVKAAGAILSGTIQRNVPIGEARDTALALAADAVRQAVAAARAKKPLPWGIEDRGRK